jgi:hypothetical protein
MAAKKSQSGLLDRARVHVLFPTALLIICGVMCASPAGLSQNNSPAGVNQGGAPYLHSQAGLNPMPQTGSSADAQMAQMRAAERQKRIAADTAKLIQLTNELKTQLDQAPNSQVSLDLVRKSAEIEKTAHDLNGWLKE